MLDATAQRHVDRRVIPRRIIPLRLTPWIVLLVALSLSLSTAILQARISAEHAARRFSRSADALVTAVQMRMASYEALLRATRALLDSTAPNRDTFRRYVEELRLSERYPGIQGLGFAPVFEPTRENVQAIERRAQAEGSPAFHVFPAPRQGLASAILYLEPEDAPNRAAIGYDMLSERTRREAMLRARETGAASLSRKLVLVQDRGRAAPGFLMYLPLYEGGQIPEGPRQRAQALTGYVYAAFRANQLFHGILGSRPGPIRLRAFDGPELTQTALLHDSAPAMSAAQAFMSTVRQIEVGGRPWSLALTAPGTLMPLRERLLAPLIGLIGAIMSGMLFLLTRSQLAARRAMRVGQVRIQRSEAKRAELERERRTARREAQERLAVINALFDATPAGLAVFDEHLRFVRLNQGLADINGLPVSQHLGKTVAELLPAMDPAVMSQLSQVLRDGGAITAEVSGATRASGDTRTWLTNYAPIHGEQERVVGVAAVVLDITERTRIAREREDLLEALRTSNRDLDQFAYVASHDLKAPLRGIATVSHWLQEDLGETLPASSKEHLQLLRNRVMRLENMIDGILRYSRAGRAERGRQREEVHASRLLEDVCALMEVPSEARVRFPPNLPYLYTARSPITQVFMNLLSNAFQHAKRRDLIVDVWADDAGAFWHFHVRDNGEGIAPDAQARIWGVFQHGTYRDDAASTGIGLAVVRKIVQAHGGRAWVDSTLGQGADFSFTWPKREDD